MSDGDTRSEPGDLKSALARLDPLADASIQLHGILQLGLDKLPLPGSGATLQRWQGRQTGVAADCRKPQVVIHKTPQNVRC